MNSLPKGKWSVGEWIFWVGAVAGYFLFPDHRALGSQILLTALFVLSLDLILGYVGVVSLGHAAFFGIGAYCAGILAARGWSEPISGLIAAGLLAAVCGYAMSFLVIRASDLARMMITLGVAGLLQESANQMSWLTGGADGLQGASTGPVFGVFHFDLFGKTAYGYCLAVLALAFVVIRRWIQAPIGLSLLGIRANAERMQALGVPVPSRLRFAFTAGAGLAGLSGALLAQTTQFVGLDVFGVLRSADVIMMLVIGGAGWLYGGLLGAAAFMLVQDLLSSVSPLYWQFWMGILLIAVVLFARGGLGGAGKRLVAAYRRKQG